MVLVMDDDKLVLATARLMLRRLGYEPVLAADIEETLRIYTEHLERGTPFDAVILDLVIQGGFAAPAVARKLLELDPRARLVLASGSPGHPVMVNYADYGFTDCIVKPYMVAELGTVLGGLID